MEHPGFTSAGRLLDEAKRIRAAITTSGARAHSFSVYAVQVFGAPERHWTRGCEALAKLAAEGLADLDAIAVEQRRTRYQDAVEHIGAFAAPNALTMGCAALVQEHLSELTLERLEAMDESLRAAGRIVSFDTARANNVVSELEVLLAEIANSPIPSEIDDFLKVRLSELRDVIEHYVLFGPKGVIDLLGAIVGGMAIRVPTPASASPQTREAMRRAYQIVKLAMDGVVYGKSAVEALSWAGDVLQITSSASA